MSTTTQTSPDVRALDSALNAAILKGDILNAFEQFYAEDVVMQENTAEPFVGKALNRQREQDFLASVEAVHNVELLGSAVEGNRTYSEWVLDVTFKGAGRAALTQVAVRQWKNGQVAHERFYYSKG